MSPASPQPTLLLAPEIFTPGGIPRILQLYLKSLCEHASATGGTVRLVALNNTRFDPSDLARYATPALTEHLACAGHKTRFVRGVLSLSRDCRHLVCGHVAQLPVAWAAQKIRRGLTYSLVAHGIEVWREFSLAERLALRGASRIFCVSQFTRSELLARCPLPPERLVVLPNALDPFFAIGPGEPLAQCPPTILCVTRLTSADSYKGVDHLIAAMPAVRAAIPAATLRVIGSGDDRARLQALAGQNDGLGAGIAFPGYLDDRQLSAEMRRCRLFALPSEKEGFGLVFLEAMAHGRPCVGVTAGGIPEVVTAKTGVLAQYGDVPALAAACIAALHHRWDETAILARASEFSYERFNHRLQAFLAG